MFVIGADQDSFAYPVPADPSDTVIENAGSETRVLPSVTEIVMSLNVPAAVGVPYKRPVLGLNVAQGGRAWISNRSESLSGSLAWGVKPYACCSRADVVGCPWIEGGELPAGFAPRFGRSDVWRFWRDESSKQPVSEQEVRHVSTIEARLVQVVRLVNSGKSLDCATRPTKALL